MNDDLLDLDRRNGLPAEWLTLLSRHPRSSWQSPGTLGMTAQFWLDRHQAFRQLGQALQDSIEALRAGRSAPEDFQAGFVPRLRLFLGELNGHHQVEDLHYFPVFRQAEPDLAPGFELLDRDHQTLHAELIATAEAANALLQALARDPSAAEGPLETYAEISGDLLSGLLRHLDDEEDLVIPLMIELGEIG
ncbi:hemerythrin domain-containing protein [Pelagibius marinus]|uniref:hemerythrin domain-containing protein n=1 Tax=Pelagibius marinus TaxID=2762760 RepID=UPI001872D80C|nr:hemerythrin domain-containing protein [Pelagibius marinus]